MRFACFSEQIAIIALNRINILVFIVDTQFVFSEAGSGLLKVN
jgi:hypothetical protein